MYRVRIPAGCMPRGLFVLVLLAGIILAPESGATEFLDGMYAGSEDSVAAPVEEETVRQGLCMKLEKGGAVVIELYPDMAPLAVARITELAEQGFYDGLKFHRVESFLVQTGRKEHELPPVEGEMFSQELWHEEGMVGMARLPNDYDTASSQFYIMKERRPGLNGEYTLFGRVIEGMESIYAVKKGHKIESLIPCKLK